MLDWQWPFLTSPCERLSVTISLTREMLHTIKEDSCIILAALLKWFSRLV